MCKRWATARSTPNGKIPARGNDIENQNDSVPRRMIERPVRIQIDEGVKLTLPQFLFSPPTAIPATGKDAGTTRARWQRMNALASPWCDLMSVPKVTRETLQVTAPI